MIPAPERSFRGRSILVTGGAGFVGGAVTRRLLEMGARVTVLDDLFTGLRDTVPPEATFIEGSVTDEGLVGELVADAAIVFHLAARNIIASTANPRDDYATNIGGTLNVLLAARDSRPDRVVYSSSASIYMAGPSRQVRAMGPRARESGASARTRAPRYPHDGTVSPPRCSRMPRGSDRSRS